MAEPEEGIEITRVFDAPRDRVWKEWTEPERFADWFGGPESKVPLSSVSMDVRPGGWWRLTMPSPSDSPPADPASLAAGQDQGEPRLGPPHPLAR